MLFRYSGIAALISLGTRLFFYAGLLHRRRPGVHRGGDSLRGCDQLISYVKSFIGEHERPEPAASALAAGDKEDKLRTLATYSTRLSLASPFRSPSDSFSGERVHRLLDGPELLRERDDSCDLAGMLSLSIAQSGTVSILYGLGRHNTFVKRHDRGVLNVD